MVSNSSPIHARAEIAEKRAFLELVNRAWTDPKSIKFALFSQQFRKLPRTHVNTVSH